MRTRKPFLIILALVVIGALIAATADAMPPHPSLLEKLEQDQSNLQPVHKSCPQPKLEGAPNGRSFGEPIRLTPGGPAVTGNILCVLIQFSDKPSQVNAVNFDSLMFGNYQGAVKHYYNEVSYGGYDVVTVNYPSALGWQTAPQTYAYYCNGNNGLGSYPQNSQKLFEDIIEIINPVVDFSNYDNNNDGFVDAVMLVHTGPGAEFTGSDNDIWSHAWGISPRSRDGKWISAYAMMPEYWQNPGDMTCGVFAHEMGHAFFDYPDLYDIDYSSKGVARWSLMAGGSWNGALGNTPAHPDAWCKVYAGFTTATNVVANQINQSIPNVEQNASGAIFRLWTNGTAGQQYFLIENRQKTGYDSQIPASGLLIWHIDDGMASGNNTDNANEWYPGHTSSGHYRVALEQADGLWELEKNLDNGDAGDPFPGSSNKTSFSGLSTPSSNDYSDQNTLVAVTNISASASTMTADLAVSLIADIDDYNYDGALPNAYSLDQNWPNPFNPTTQITFALPEGGRVNLTVYNLLGEKVEQLVDGFLPAGTHTLTWQAQDNGQQLASGVYLYELVTEEVSLTRKMVLLK